MLEYNQITQKKYIVLDGEPYEVLSSAVAKKQRQKPVNQTKIKHMISGKVTNRSFHQSDKVKEAEIDSKEVKYLYNNRGEWWFSDIGNPKDRFTLLENNIGDSKIYLKENTVVVALTFNDEIIGIKLPPKVDLLVSHAPPNIKGNTSSGGNKQVITETGAVVSTPLFIEEGDTIRVNTETGAYSERV